MPGFDALYKQTVTLFNRKEVGDETFWHVSVLDGVHLIIDRAAIISTYGEQATDNAKLHIRYTPSKSGAVVATRGGARTVLKPKEFRAYGNPSTNITFAFGNEFDFIMAGVFDEYILHCSVESKQQVSATIDDAVWRSSPLSVTGDYEFSYDGNGWTYGGVSVNLSSYGITVTGEPAENDTINVVYVSPEGPIPDDEYRSGFFNYMNKEHDDVFAISSVSKFNLIPHFEIAAK